MLYTMIPVITIAVAICLILACSGEPLSMAIVFGIIGALAVVWWVAKTVVCLSTDWMASANKHPALFIPALVIFWVGWQQFF